MRKEEKSGDSTLDGVTVSIAPTLRGHITYFDMINPQGTLEFQSDYAQFRDHKIEGFLFQISADDYCLEVGIINSTFYIMRNEYRLEWKVDPLQYPAGHIHCFAMWTPTWLRLILLDDAMRKTPTDKRGAHVEAATKTIITRPTLPPVSILKWARRNAIAPMVTYDSERHFFEEVAASVKAIEDEINTLNLHNPFWDITYERGRISARLPKHETDIHPTIHALLYQIAIAKNFEIVPEYSIRGGRLDFLILGTVREKGIANVCVEFKLAHSPDIFQGLVKQLPAYMKSKGSGFGIYCVLFFKGKHFAEPAEYNIEQLDFALESQRKNQLLDSIRVMVIDTGFTTPPSKL